MHEPLTIGIFLPLLHFSPRNWKRVKFLVSFGISLSAMYKAGDPSAGDLLCEFWLASTWIAGMPERLVCDLLLHPSWRRFLDKSRNDEDGNDMTAPGEESDYLSARPGDHLFCPFECDVCAFFRLKHRHADPNSRTDALLQIYI
jgi:hypothetical protein